VRCGEGKSHLRNKPGKAYKHETLNSVQHIKTQVGSPGRHGESVVFVPDGRDEAVARAPQSVAQERPSRALRVKIRQNQGSRNEYQYQYDKVHVAHNSEEPSESNDSHRQSGELKNHRPQEVRIYKALKTKRHRQNNNVNSVFGIRES
jgi:hypothetical protein